jgi:glucoamylase
VTTPTQQRDPGFGLVDAVKAIRGYMLRPRILASALVPVAAAFATMLWLRGEEIWTPIDANATSEREVATALEWTDDGATLLVGTASGTVVRVSANGVQLADSGKNAAGAVFAVHGTKTVGAGANPCPDVAASSGGLKEGAESYVIGAFSRPAKLWSANNKTTSQTCGQYPSKLSQFAVDELGDVYYALPEVKGDPGAVAVTRLADNRTYSFSGSPVRAIAGLRNGAAVGRESGEVELFEMTAQHTIARRQLRFAGPTTSNGGTSVGDRIEHLAAARGATVGAPALAIVTPSGRLFVSGKEGSEADPIDFGAASSRLFLGGAFAGMEFSSDGETLLLRRLDGSVALMRAVKPDTSACSNSGWVLLSVSLGAPLGALDAALSADGKTLAIAASDNSIRILDVSNAFSATGQAAEVAEIRGHSDLRAAMSLSQDGTKLAVADFDGNLSITDLTFARMVWWLEWPLRPMRPATPILTQKFASMPPSVGPLPEAPPGAAAPCCCGVPPVHDSAQKSMLGTAVNSATSAVYFTGFRGNVSEVYYPTIDTLATSNMEFLVGDTGRTFLDEEKNQSWTVTRPDPMSMRWQAVTSNAGHNWQITKTIFADPSNNTLIQQTTFEALNGATVGNFNLYLLYKPYLKNVAANNSAMTVVSGGNTYLVASGGHGSEFSAVGASLSWNMQNNVTMVSNGYAGVNDGWQDLYVNNPTPFKMRWAYNAAPNGNVAQMGWLDTAGNSATSIAFEVAVGFGATEAAAIAAVSNTLAEDVSAQQSLYDEAWHSYAAGLSTQNGTADDQYYLSAMTLKTMQDKTNGAMIAGIGTPWGFAEGDNDVGGYHMVWPRDLYKSANALISAGDAVSATSAVNWLFNVDMNQSTGRFPQNSYVNGTFHWNATQMDEQAMPIILAYRLGASVYNALWPKIRLAANYVYNNGPWTQQERWEETSGYSPSTIAAEIAGLVDAAQIALANNDAADAANWLSAADYWQRNVTGWTYTTQGCPSVNWNCNSASMYMRINTSPAQGGSAPDGWNPSAYPNPNMAIQIGNNGGTHRAIDIIDSGFLELVRMGVKRPNDPTITSSLAAYDNVIKQSIGDHSAWFRYNFDGYGETNAGGPYDGSSGRGRLWPLFDAERGNYWIAASGSGGAGSPYLAALKAFSTPQGFIPEQVWNSSATLPGDTDSPSGWAVTTPAGSAPGAITGSMEPLNWTQGEYITLLADIAAGKVLDIPQAVCSRYYACVLPPAPGQVQVDINVNAATQSGQSMYVTGDAAALGAWNTSLGLPLDSADYPVWKNAIHLAAGGAVQYKYYRKNPDGSVTWECYPGGGNCNGNRSLTAPSSGPFSLNDTVSWN